MGYNIEKVEWNESLPEVSRYEYALIYLMSDLILCRVEELPEIKWEECLEARFFSKDEELHIFEQDGRMSAVRVTDDGAEDIQIQQYQLDKRFSNLGKILLVQEYLMADEDGQVQVILTRLKGIE